MVESLHSDRLPRPCRCGDTNFGMSPNPINCPFGQTMQCSSTAVDCNGFGVLPNYWGSSNSAIMSVNSSGVVSGNSVGSATITADFNNVVVMTGQLCGGYSCPTSSPAPTAGGNVPPTVNISGPNGVPVRKSGYSVGTNSTSLSAFGNPNGGTFLWTANSTRVTIANTTSADVVINGQSPSGTPGDVTMTVKYTYNGQSASASKAFSVQQPSALFQQSGAITTSEAACTTSQGDPGCGVTKNLKWQVQD